MTTNCLKPSSSATRGFALAVSLILLVALTLIAVSVIRTTGLGARMTANNSVANEAFEVSESTRGLAEILVEGATYYAGWPCSMVTGSATCGGSPPLYAIPDSQWDATLLPSTGMTVLREGQTTCTAASNSNPHKSWWVSNSEQDSSRTSPYGTSYVFNPISTSTPLDADACYTRTVNGYAITGNISVYKLRIDNSGIANPELGGYLGLGRTGANGGHAFFHTQSDGADPAGLAQSQTASVYRVLLQSQ